MEIIDILFSEEKDFIIVQFDDMNLNIPIDEFIHYLAEHEQEVYHKSKTLAEFDYTDSRGGEVIFENVFDYDYFLETWTDATKINLIKEYIKLNYPNCI